MTDTTGRNESVVADLNSKSERSSMVELKNGKVVLKQKCPSFEKLSETLQEIVKFREMLALRIERGDPPLLSIPDEHRPVIAKLTHESDKTLSALTKHIQNELLPPQDDTEEHILSSVSSSFPFQAVEGAIKSIGIRNNYGLDSTGAGKVPAAVCVWRWEVKEEYRHWLPKNAREKAEVRLAERAQAKKDLIVLFESLTQDERDAILGPKSGIKFPSRDRRNIMPNTSIVDLTEEFKSASPPSKEPQQRSDEGNNAQHFLDPCEKINALQTMKMSLDPAKDAKDKENSKKKASKGKKEKKEKQGDLKSRSLMNFFGKAKSNYRSSPAQETPDVAALSSSSRSDFEKTFKPFLLKKDAELAPVNWFMAKGELKDWSGTTTTDAILVDIVDDQTTNKPEKIPDVHDGNSSVDDMSTRERLLFILSSLPLSADASRHYRFPKTIFSPHLGHQRPPAVRDIVSRLTEAEIAGDISLVRSLLARLSDRTLFTPKLFIFAEDSRPGYFGTWTRKSANIRPRSPFKRDPVVVEYGYDSGEEWEDEGAGDADDVIDDGDEDGETEDRDSDLDSWLVDDDDDILDAGSPSDERSTPPLPTDFPPPPKRKLKDEDQKLGKKRKVVVPLVPFVKGPCWDSAVGHCEYDLFRAYQIRLFNDTPFPINPFTFVSAVQERRSDTVFAVPSLPDRLVASNTSAATPVPGPSISCPSIPFIQVDPSPANAVVRRTVPSPKTVFPNIHLPLLLAKITLLQTGNFTFLVESIFQELRGLNVKKNAIEAKIKEVAEKSKERKIWIVKQDIMA